MLYKLGVMTFKKNLNDLWSFPCYIRLIWNAWKEINHWIFRHNSMTTLGMASRAIEDKMLTKNPFDTIK